MNDTVDELHNALHHLELAQALELSAAPRYPRRAQRTEVLDQIAAALVSMELAVLSAEGASAPGVGRLRSPLRSVRAVFRRAVRVR